MSAQDGSQVQPQLSSSRILQRLKRSLSPNSQTLLKQAGISLPAPLPVQDTLNPPNAGGSVSKEASLLSVTLEHPMIDATGGIQYVEQEKPHELPPEVEGFLKTVEDHQDQIPQEIVIANPQTGQALPRVMAQPVIVLPITPEIEEAGKKKQPSYSVRWLVEWSWKMMKAFSGRVVYRTAKN